MTEADSVTLSTSYPTWAMLGWNLVLHRDKLIAIYSTASIKITPRNGVFEKLIIKDLTLQGIPCILECEFSLVYS
jgi:hypothetical protein